MYVSVVVSYVCMLTAFETLSLLSDLVNKESEGLQRCEAVLRLFSLSQKKKKVSHLIVHRF